MDESRLGSPPLVTHAVALGSWSLAIGGAAGFVAGLPTALIGDRVAPPFQGVAIGWLRTVTDGGHILGPVVMGALADATHLFHAVRLRGGTPHGDRVAVPSAGDRVISVNVSTRQRLMASRAAEVDSHPVALRAAGEIYPKT